MMLRGLPVRRTSGRPRKKKQCLQREEAPPGQYTVDALVSRLVNRPASVINWSVLHTWQTKNSLGEIEDRDFVGIVEPPFMKGGARYWDVNFSKRNETVSMAAEQLANAGQLRAQNGAPHSPSQGVAPAHAYSLDRVVDMRLDVVRASGAAN
jgi:hypothetical protein